ncbi:MAG: hypothetical protein Q8Q52_06855 [Acidimicrobiia bacterium]|nr:hypothetical protein [Acidimicrobiia bacterium]
MTSANELSQALTTIRYGRNLEHFPIAVSVEALAQAWLRQRNAPTGAVVVADREISGRSRLGKPFAAQGGLNAAVVVRPPFSPEAEGLLWTWAGLAAVDGYRAVVGPAAMWWPDLLVADGQRVGTIGTTALLAPGRIEAAALSFRVEADPNQVPPLLDAVLRSLEASERQMPDELIQRFSKIDHLWGRQLELALAPRGMARGVAVGPDLLGRWTIRTADGVAETYTVDQVRAIRIVP